MRPLPSALRPVGLSMEGFDPIGKTRTKDLAGRPIDNVVALPDGKEARGVPEFATTWRRSASTSSPRRCAASSSATPWAARCSFPTSRCWRRCRPSWRRTTIDFPTLFELVVTSPQFRNQRCKDFTPSRFQDRTTQERNHERRNKISRRVLLKGLGFTVALPWLESVPRRWRPRPAAQAKPPQRFACLFIGDGISPPHWWAKGNGAEMELGSSLEPLAPFKEKLNVINGLFNQARRRRPRPLHRQHPLRAPTCIRGRMIHGGVSMDQKLAQAFRRRDRRAQPGARLRAAGQRLPREPVFDGLRLAHLVAQRRIRRSRSSCTRRSPSTASSAARPASCKGASSTTCWSRPTTCAAR